MRLDLRKSIDGRNFEDLNIDGSSAAGYPYRQGMKRRDVKHDAISKAHLLLADGDAFDIYASDHVWYTTGRAKMQEVEKEDAGRLILYAGYAFMLIGMLVCQTWAKYMNSAFDWCGVGFSWMHGGDRKSVV